MLKKVLERDLQTLEIINSLNNNKRYFTTKIKKDNFDKEQFYKQLLIIIKSKIYLYYLNSKGYYNLKKFINYYNNKDLFEIVSNGLTDLIDNPINEYYEEINGEKILLDFCYEQPKMLLSTEIDLLKHFLENKELSNNNKVLPYIIILFVNKYNKQITFNDLAKLLNLLKSFYSDNYFMVYEYLNINFINNLYTDFNIETFDFYSFVLLLMNKLKIENKTFYDQDNNLISEAFNSKETEIFDEEMLEVIPNIINFIISSSHYCYCLDENNIQRLYDLINYYRFVYINGDVNKYLFCNKIIGKLNDLSDLLNNCITKDSYQKYFETLIKKEIIDITHLSNQQLIKFKRFNPRELDDLYVADNILFLYLNSSETIYNIPTLNKFLYTNPLIDLSILYLLNRKLNLLESEDIEALKELINIRINNRLQMKNNDNIKYIHGYVKTLKYINRFMNEDIDYN